MRPHLHLPPAPGHRPHPALLEFTQVLRASPGQVPSRPQDSCLDLRILFSSIWAHLSSEQGTGLSGKGPCTRIPGKGQGEKSQMQWGTQP